MVHQVAHSSTENIAHVNNLIQSRSWKNYLLLLQTSLLWYYQVFFEKSHSHSFIHLRHAALGVCSGKSRHRSPEWMILSHDDCFVQGEVIGFQVLLDSLHPRSTRASCVVSSSCPKWKLLRSYSWEKMIKRQMLQWRGRNFH